MEPVRCCKTANNRCLSHPLRNNTNETSWITLDNNHTGELTGILKKRMQNKLKKETILNKLLC